jgi:NAD(P)-dependent dehydrogenase (short-subunit alcohol dehydrogenase family)
VKAWRNLIDINVTGSFICARAAFARMKAQDPQGGRIINNGSVSAYVPRWGSAPYSASKHAITGLTRSISLDGRPYSIACGQIDIGNALTDMAHAMTQGVPQADGSMAVEPVMDVKHVATSLLHMAELPLDANVQFMTVMATNMPYIGRG